jgi:tetraacyldisaccharide 4'-kinase
MTVGARPPKRPAIERLWRNDLSIAQRSLWAALVPAAAIYAGVLSLRARWWRKMAQDPGVTTISVGNLTVGGNGKTPFTIFLATRLQRAGYRVGIVSRGYGRLSSEARDALVSDGTKILLSAAEAGDEPAMIARSFSGPVAIARRRADGIAILSQRSPVDIVILDDGFQHIRLRRDLDLILVNAARGFGNGWLLPAGPMRERRQALRRADAVITIASGVDPEAKPSGYGSEAFLNATSMHAALRPSGLVHPQNGEWRQLPISIVDRRVAIASGLANSTGFHEMVRALGAQICATLDYPDHYDYTLSDWQHIQDAARDAHLLLTTEKDLVKLEKFCSGSIPLYALRLEVVMADDDETRLLAMVAERARRRGVLPTNQSAHSLRGGLH